MLRFKRMLMTSLLAALGAIAFAAPAQADVHLKCTIDTANATTDPPVQNVGAKGSYTFSDTTIACVGDEKGTPVQVTATDVSSTGEYKNVVCGLGKAIADPGGIVAEDVTGGTKDYQSLIEDLKYEVEFTGAGNGILYWHGPFGKIAAEKPQSVIDNTLEDPVFNPKPQDPKKEYYLGGVIQLSLPPGHVPEVDPNSPTLGDCTDAFGVHGVIDIDDTPLP